MNDEISIIQKIGLGTVQFGFDYGIANKRGKIPESEIFEILNFAWEQGVDTLDTAATYGDSEEVIGRFIEKSKLNYRVISKAPVFDGRSSSCLADALEATLNRLRQKKIYGYLIHKFDNIVGQRSLLDELQEVKRSGLVDKIGFSLYRVEELQYLLDRNIPIDILQVPYNIFDQRFAKHFRSLKTREIEVHVRSVFLQGLFFLDTKELSGAMEMGRDNLKKLHDISSEQDVPLQYLCLCFVLLNAYLDKVIIGVDSIDQLRQNMDFVNYMAKTEEVYGQLENLKVEDEEVILPFLWEQNKS